MTTWIGQDNGSWEMSGLTPMQYESSAGVSRGFCPNCGTPLFYRSDAYPDETHFYAALLDNAERIKPTGRYHAEEALAWLHESGKLPAR